MKRALIPFFFALTCCTAALAQAQTDSYTKYKIVFTDKKGTPYSLQHPGDYLSARAIQRRMRQQIAIDSTDLPITPRYIDSVLNTGNVNILIRSKWLNQIVIQTKDTLALKKIRQFSFVRRADAVAKRLAPSALQAPADKFQLERMTQPASPTFNKTNNFSYGKAYDQIHLHEGEFLHNNGFQGEGMLMAILDAGFVNVNTNRAFADIRNNHQILGTYDFVNGAENVFGFDAHGAQVFSIIASNLPGEMIGTAPKAQYWLLRTEDASSEQPIEEDNWAAGAELADSAGVDVISSSLGYNLFDNAVYNHTYADMNGHTTDVSKAASLAVKKGMIVVNSAGNEGSRGWKYIIAPADGIGVIAVGAVNLNGQVASFSSYGPSADGRIKPDVAATGSGTTLVSPGGNLVTGNGTSYSCPVIAGLITCLWQAFPEFTNNEMLDVLHHVSSLANHPDDRLGYGIPNFRIAFDSLIQRRLLRAAPSLRDQLDQQAVQIAPNPFQQSLQVYCKSQSDAPIMIEVIDASGRIRARKRVSLQPSQYYVVQFNDETPHLPRGIYFIRVLQGSFQKTVKAVRN